MSELSPTSGGLPVAAGYADTRLLAKNASFMTTIFLLFVVGVASLLVAEQILTGWLPFGERANILRGNLNVIELAAAAAAIVWGLLTLRTALGFLRHERMPSMHDYFERADTHMAPGVLLTIVLLGVVGLLSLVIAEQVLTGWLPLGERTNILRSNLNGPEMTVILITTLWGLLTLRTVWGLLIHDKRAWAYAQWVIMITAVIGMTLLLNGVLDIHTVLPMDATIFENLPGVQVLTGPGLLLFLSCIAVYRFISIGVDTTAAQTTRNTLAKAPGAGAIVGFIALLIVFSLATDLFLEPRSLAGITATNITRGIVAIGITFLMISGEFDLSVGSTFGAGALVFLLMMTEGVFGITTSVIPAAIIALIFAGILGFINGMILILTGIPSFIVTLGTLLAYRAILLVVVADGRILRYADYRLPPPYIWINRWILVVGALALAGVVFYMSFRSVISGWRRLQARLANYQNDASDFRDLWVLATGLRLVLVVLAIVVVGGLLLRAAAINLTAIGVQPVLEISFFEIMNGQLDFVPRDVNLRMGVFWWFLLVLIFQFVLTETRYGNHVMAVGGNPGAALAQGINVRRVKLANFVLCSMLACLAGIISVSRLSNVDPLMGDGLELEVIAASVIGGALLSGGYGSIVGALLGVLIFGMLQTGLVLVGVDARAFSGIVGIIIIIAVIINTAVRLQKK